MLSSTSHTDDGCPEPQAYTESTFQRIADAVGEVVHRVMHHCCQSGGVQQTLIRYSTGSRITINGEAMSIFARRQALPSSKPPARIFFRTTPCVLQRQWSRYTGCFTLGCVRVPRYFAICSGVSRQHTPVLC
uniref:Uncharacterized protein n=1 Tax=Salmonella sp. TaxID=599 RepID=A0A482ETM9_SALSP|nr:hypothetical protein NNIBIDOC_00241 [Salmonella sp.]